MKTLLNRYKSGYTLIELLVVIAVLAVLATAGFTLLNPQEQIVRSNDAKKKAELSTLVKALVVFSATHNSLYPSTDCASPLGNNWIGCLKNDNELTTDPKRMGGVSPSCSGGRLEANTYCYKVNIANDSAAVYIQLESKSAKQLNNCSNIVYYYWRSQTEKLDFQCDVEPEP